MKKLILQLSQALAVCVLLLSHSLNARANETVWSQAELDQMLAPVALYPDTVLTHVLIAATYPLEVVQASRWVKDNPRLSGEDAVRAVEDKNWDPSVKALVAFPQLLERLSDDLDWTQQLGEAFLADETAVLASIQTLRQKAYSKGTLRDNKHIVVEREREVIVIEPARREVVYVPVYDTRVVYGDWWWPHHPPVYWHTAGVYYRNSPFYWGVSVNVRPWFYFGIFDWRHRHVVVHHHYYHTPPRYYPKRHKHYVDARRWQHSPEHRRGVHYRHDKLNRTYNSGYGYQQPTRETQGKPIRHTRVTEHRPASTAQLRENKAQYQRKSAEQVQLTQRQWQDNERSPRQHNEALRQQRQHNSEQRVRTTQVQTEQRQQQIKQQLAEPRPHQRAQPERVISTEQLRQRAQPERQPAVREETRIQHSGQPAINRELRERPVREVPVVREQRQPQREAAPTREMRQPARESNLPQRQNVQAQRHTGQTRRIE
ncbi:DUF3300 domain-containing protein [Rheinheimera nanhaiensis]|uniref:DUF3300 domain-containing protein n=1 Tax=Rheinheimera nanhaiensis E407-8 TaxID=562729 RepID=I1DUW2_9GAMM|nr:DUF3300 domain-containing protein [Rheinheimera nanhaiensis]GAB57840.1 hypothetical protein RNAN_0810 [Rheinheimera nanhaiensis E407-8]